MPYEIKQKASYFVSELAPRGGYSSRGVNLHVFLVVT